MTAGPGPPPPSAASQASAPPLQRVSSPPGDLLSRWIPTQSVNLDRQGTALRPFTYTEFGTGPAAPSRAHIDAVNQFVGQFRARLADGSGWGSAGALQAAKRPTDQNIALFLSRKEAASNRILYVEGIWDFYFD